MQSEQIAAMGYYKKQLQNKVKMLNSKRINKQTSGSGTKKRSSIVVNIGSDTGGSDQELEKAREEFRESQLDINEQPLEEKEEEDISQGAVKGFYF